MNVQKKDTSVRSIDGTRFGRMLQNPKKRLFWLITLLLILVLITGVTMAYLVEQGTAYNVITTPTLDMTLHEETTGGVPFPEGGISNVMPGSIMDKVVFLENTGNVDYYARIGLSVSINGEEYPLDTQALRLDINDQDWTRQYDGEQEFFYYSRALAPGERTENLFTTVAFSQDMGNEYKRARVEIVVNAQAVQSRNNGTSALDAQGWASVVDSE